jgi:hypothetical protein
MKTILKSAAGLALIFVMVAATAFTGKPGGDSYSIYLNDKMLVQHFVYMKKSLPHVAFNQASPEDKVVVFYSHCGRTGTARVISVRDKSNNVLKNFKFPDAVEKAEGMRFSLRDLNALQKAPKENLSLYYFSKEIPEGKMLATVSVSDNAMARK